ncbi:beta-glucosidase/6-phospho-beta-glucosidase/beta-galactosidase [Neorhizobium sp. 2083]|uniref:beta-glucosidase n=1 Tax=Neorhizobium sp. 2083 TaxID=2817762 RepID=UPI00285B49E4|nr:beta-glucosidase [Neorhizobium sp. 2083]MDR6821063.1 beta-glucosidase/6-phospho-beta-glucosidase/beta-galactosidase [Neorhizobium sp. 2083]
MFKSFLLGGFECSAHKRKDGRRVDMLAATRHDELAERDYRQLQGLGIMSVRDGLRWHLIERRPHRYDWSSSLPMIQAAAQTGTEVIWDLCHYGWPNGLDIWSPSFVERFANFSRAAAEVIAAETSGRRFYCPINEISFWAWGGGQVGYMNPCAVERGAELKRQLVRAFIAASETIREVDPDACIIVAEPSVNITTGSEAINDIAEAEKHRLYQFEAVDMLLGKQAPELGGHPRVIDVIGMNFYPTNQWYHFGPGIPFGHHHFKAFADMIVETHERFDLPVFVAETGAEASSRPGWLHYISTQVEEAMHRGTPVRGICLYPVTAYPGWDNDRICETGVIGMAGFGGDRPVYEPLAAEIRRESLRFNGRSSPHLSIVDGPTHAFS